MAPYLKSNVPSRLHLGFQWRDFPEASHSTSMRYKRCKFCFVRSIIKGTLLEEYSAFSAVFLVTFLRYYSIFIYYTLHECYKNYAVCFRTVKNSVHFAWRTHTFSSVSRLQLEEFSWKFIPRITRACDKTVQVVCDESIPKGTFRGQQCASLAVSRVALEGFSWKFTQHIFHIGATNGGSLVVVGQ
jgi:hypothetical protein